MNKVLIGYFVGFLVATGTVICFNMAFTANSYKLGQEVQKVIDVCEEKLPRNEKCTFLIVPEAKLIYDEEKNNE